MRVRANLARPGSIRARAALTWARRSPRRRPRRLSIMTEPASTWFVLRQPAELRAATRRARHDAGFVRLRAGASRATARAGTAACPASGTERLGAGWARTLCSPIRSRSTPAVGPGLRPAHPLRVVTGTRLEPIRAEHACPLISTRREVLEDRRVDGACGSALDPSARGWGATSAGRGVSILDEAVDWTPVDAISLASVSGARPDFAIYNIEAIERMLPSRADQRVRRPPWARSSRRADQDRRDVGGGAGTGPVHARRRTPWKEHQHSP